METNWASVMSSGLRGTSAAVRNGLQQKPPARGVSSRLLSIPFASGGRQSRDSTIRRFDEFLGLTAFPPSNVAKISECPQLPTMYRHGVVFRYWADPAPGANRPWQPAGKYPKTVQHDLHYHRHAGIPTPYSAETRTTSQIVYFPLFLEAFPTSCVTTRVVEGVAEYAFPVNPVCTPLRSIGAMFVALPFTPYATSISAFTVYA